MKCEELLALLNEYVDSTVDPAICEEFEKHLAGCNPCQVVVDNIRKTVTLYKGGKPLSYPSSSSGWRPGHRARACEIRRKSWWQTGGGGGTLLAFGKALP